MKLAAIYNVWDGVELLKGSMDCIKNDVDLFIIVYQTISNFGEEYNPFPEINISEYPHVLIEYVPQQFGGQFNETNKRNLGLKVAKEQNCTHFLFLDCDEYYSDFKTAKELYLESNHMGSVCMMYTYFKTPTLRLTTADNYYVPFIHMLKTDTAAGECNYPYYVDRTRKVNETNVCLLPIFMHHFSWVRIDIERKIRNSSAKRNIFRSQLLIDYNNPELKPGYYLQDYKQSLIEVDNIFQIQ